MPPLEEIGRSNHRTSAAAGAAAAGAGATAYNPATGTSLPARVAGSTAMRELIALGLKDDDSDDDDDDDSVVEIVDLPDANSAHDQGNGGGTTSPTNMARRTRSHNRPAASAAAFAAT